MSIKVPLSFIIAFLDALRFEKRYSPHTIRSYQDDLTQFFDFLQVQFGELTISQVSPSLVRSWLASLKDAKLTAKSINRKISALKSFFRYQMRVGIIEVTPMTNIVAPGIGKRLPQYIDQKDMAALLTDVDFPDTWKGKTDYLLISIFYQTGIRESELVNLKETDVDLANATMKVLGKGNKERIIPLNDSLARQMDEYRSDKRKVLDAYSADYLLVSKNGKKLYARYIYRVVHDYLGQVTTVKKRSPHILRHTFATHLTNNGADLNAVKELLGHSSLAATQVYTHNTIERLKDIHKKAHPKS